MKVLFSLAHPDDETFFSGGTIAKLTQSGVEVKLICATRGEAGNVGNPPVCSKEELPKVREQELRSAAKILGISEIFFLDLIDGTLDKIPQKEIEQAVWEVIKKEQPDVVFTFEKRGISNHPDHQVMSTVTTEVFKKYLMEVKKQVRLYHSVLTQSYLDASKKADVSYTAFGELKGTPDEQVSTQIDIADFYEIKDQAARCHKTQLQDWEMISKVNAKMGFKKEFFQLILENDIL